MQCLAVPRLGAGKTRFFLVHGLERPHGSLWPRSGCQRWGSIKGDVKKKHLSLRRKGSKFLTSSSCPVAAIRSAVFLGILLFMLLVAPADTLAPTSSVVAFGQPWFYLRLEAYRFIGLSEEAYGRSRDSRPEPHFRILILEPVARSWRRNAGHPAIPIRWHGALKLLVVLHVRRRTVLLPSRALA